MIYVEYKLLTPVGMPNLNTCRAKNYRDQDHTPFFPLTTYATGSQVFYLEGASYFVKQTLRFRGVMCGDPE